MRDDICTIPVSEIFEINDDCPICRMIETVEKRIVSYILGDAMMEPDIRIETNRLGFCEKHYDQMLNSRGRLQLALMLQTHIDELNKNLFSKKPFNSSHKKGEKITKISDSCFICSKIESGVSRMIETIYRCYENEKDFRDMFNNQEMFCLVHYERLISGYDKKSMKRYGSEFLSNLNRITVNYSKNIYDNISKYCTLYDYRSRNSDIDYSDCKDSIEKSIGFLTGRKF